MFTEVLRTEAPGLSPELAESLWAYWKLVKKKNEVMNLTAVTEDDEAARRHFLDALALLELADFPQGARVVDVGTGAGFPGVPLKLARPDLRLCLLDSLGKRVDFLREALETLGVEAECVHARAEEFGLLPERRDESRQYVRKSFRFSYTRFFFCRFSFFHSAVTVPCST